VITPRVLRRDSIAATILAVLLLVVAAGPAADHADARVRC